MDIKLDDDGKLHIRRAGEWKRQECPFQEYSIACGDWCPLFSEPVFREADTPEREPVNQLWLCQDKLLTGAITDERGRQA